MNDLGSLARALSKSAIGVLSALALSGCSLFGVSTVEEPEYKVILSDGDIEIREYESVVMVETVTEGEYEEASDKSFRKLFKYISGENVAQQEVSMTAPVTMFREGVDLGSNFPFFSEQKGSGWTMSFVLPGEYEISSAPVPTNPAVRLKQIPPKRVAALQFSGRWSAERFDDKLEELSDWLEENSYQAVSTPRVAAYNPPWTIPFLRRNEVQVDLGPARNN